MSGFLIEQGTSTRLGLTLFPRSGGAQCEAPGEGVVDDMVVPLPSTDDEAGLGAAAAEISSVLGSTQPSGGTPTAASLRALQAYPPLIQQVAGRRSFALLLTDGLPNCNAAVQGSCVCTVPTCAGSSLGCLDREESVAAARALRDAGVDTFVLGFGAALADAAAYETLNALAEAGGRPRSCREDSECGGSEICGAEQLCQRRFYRAGNASELEAVLQEIKGIMVLPCLMTFSADFSGDVRVAAFLDGEQLMPGGEGYQWVVRDGVAEVTFQGAACQRLQSSSPVEPAQVRVEILERIDS
jgi:hypothetical protein